MHRLVLLSGLVAFVFGCQKDEVVVAAPPIAPIAVAPGMPGQGGPGVPLPVPGQIVSNFGTITLMPGFQPDPHVVVGSSGGAIQASNLNPSCTGWIAQQPDFVLQLAAPIPNLRVVINGAGVDTTLVVQRSTGDYLCNDDTDGLHPVVAGPFAAGIHRVWVGTYSRGERASYTMGVSQLGHVTPTTLVGGTPAVPVVPTPGANVAELDVTGTNSNFTDVNLAPGFSPTPFTTTGTSGGSIAAAGLGSGCTGHIARTPDHLFQATGNFGSLKVMIQSEQDTTLVVRRPDGTYLCNDDTDGFNPAVTGPFPPGQYRIWVGSYSAGNNGAYTIGFTESASGTINGIGPVHPPRPG